MMESLIYRNKIIDIVKDQRKGEDIYWLLVNKHAITFVSNPETAKRLAVNFIDTILGEYYQESRQLNYTKERMKY